MTDGRGPMFGLHVAVQEFVMPAWTVVAGFALITATQVAVLWRWASDVIDKKVEAVVAREIEAVLLPKFAEYEVRQREIAENVAYIRGLLDQNHR